MFLRVGLWDCLSMQAGLRQIPIVKSWLFLTEKLSLVLILYM